MSGFIAVYRASRFGCRDAKLSARTRIRESLLHSLSELGTANTGASIMAYTMLGIPYYDSSVIHPKTLF